MVQGVPHFGFAVHDRQQRSLPASSLPASGWTHGNATKVATSDALGRHRRVGYKSQVDDAAVGRMHRFESLRLASTTNFLGSLLRPRSQALFPERLKVLAVRTTRDDSPEIGLHQPRQKVLERSNDLALLFGYQIGVLAAKLDFEPFLARIDLGFQAQARQFQQI